MFVPPSNLKLQPTYDSNSPQETPVGSKTAIALPQIDTSNKCVMVEHLQGENNKLIPIPTLARLSLLLILGALSTNYGERSRQVVAIEADKRLY